jgi:hypothetical protein
MATPQLTTFAIAALKPRAKRYEVSDGACAGLRVSVQPSGTKSFVCRYRHRGKPGKLTFGRVDTVGLAQARKLAADARLLAAQGRAPGEPLVRGRTPSSARPGRRWSSSHVAPSLAATFTGTTTRAVTCSTSASL